MPVRGDLLECRLCFVEIWRLAIKPAKARIGIRYHRRQWLFDLVGDRARHGVSRHQPCVTLATLSDHGTKHLAVKIRYLVQQDNQDETARQDPVDPTGIPADAVAAGTGNEIRQTSIT